MFDMSVGSRMQGLGLSVEGLVFSAEVLGFRS